MQEEAFDAKTDPTSSGNSSSNKSNNLQYDRVLDNFVKLSLLHVILHLLLNFRATKIALCTPHDAHALFAHMHITHTDLILSGFRAGHHVMAVPERRSASTN
ncbi:hypothetical protein HELRODRAFT_159179 [Helobdella robusta]|uniref:Uncharacterized protein n=1 Tax=Helobdella robusta TaxID=6412 RepID=T1ENQ0_HELRO|nr:hypothetical protein HELRODRAFT_159179 [Helobdella robusta]ESO12612.1 hypothetical protein HELRODRAFT_159179 [Helobdella robusta]